MPRSQKRVIGSLALLAVGMVAGWWLARQGLPWLEAWQKPGTAAAVGDIRRVDFRNFTYAPGCAAEDHRPGDIRVSNGEFNREDSHDPLYFSILSVDYGDLTGDGRNEAAVATHCNTGGSGDYSEGLVYSMQNGIPVLIDRVEGGDRAYGGIAGLSIENGLLRVERYATDEDGPACCPKYIESTQLRWDGRQFIQEGGLTRREAAHH